MNENTLIDAIGNIDEAMIEKHIKARAVSDAGMRKRPKTRVWIKWTVLAACLALIISAIPLWALMRSRMPEYTPPAYEDAYFSAEDIAGLFPEYLGPTKYYQKVYVSDPSYLYFAELPVTDNLPVYTDNYTATNRKEFVNFVDSCLPNIFDALGIEIPAYEIEHEELRYSGSDHYSIDAITEDYYVSMSQGIWDNYVSLTRRNGTDPLRRVILNGKTVTVDQRQSDEQIIQSLSEIRAELAKMFGRDFPDAKVIREYDEYGENGVEFLRVYFYDASEHFLNQFYSHGVRQGFVPYSDYIALEFDNAVNWADDLVSKDHLTDVRISYIDYRDDVTPAFNAKIIPLEEAEKMLEAGYVFGGHSCRLCMEAQDAVDFSGYDFVGMTYVFGSSNYFDDVEKAYKAKNTTGIPFYVFFKQIETGSQNGNLLYAKTYVPAIEVSGLKEYFEAQKGEH